LEKEKKLYLANQEKLENTDKANLAQITELQRQIHELHTIKKQLEDQNSELRTRVSSLQQELDTSETVQKDFVRLSQSLQVRNPRFQSLFPDSSDIFRSNWRKSASRTRK
jgi:Rab GTPase-binding effector protein 1